MNYKLSLALFLLFIFYGCTEQPKLKINVKETPDWYLKGSLKTTVVYGYGSSIKLENAKSQAREDIAKSIKVKIESSLSMTSTSTDSSQLNSEHYIQQTQHSISEYADMILTNIKVDKYIQIGDIWFVRMSYTNLPAIEQIKNTFASTKLKKMNEGNPLLNSSFSKNLKVSFGYVPDYTIFFKNDVFFINIQQYNFILTKADIKQFFFTKHNKEISLKASKTHLNNGDYFHFLVNQRNDNYISLIQIDEIGKIIVHFDNLVVRDITYPNMEVFEGLQAGVINGKDTAIEMYLAISCRDKNNFAIFDQIGLDFNDNKDALHFPQLYNMITKCDYSSLITRTTK